MSANILVVEDEEPARTFTAALLRDLGYEVHEAATVAEARAVVERGQADIIVLDVELPDVYGLTFLEQICRDQPDIQVIIVTGFGRIDMAVEAMKTGARDFIQKPVDMARLRGAVEKAAEAVALTRELNHLRRARLPAGGWVVGDTPAMRRLANDLACVAPSATTILITGESGTGKEVIANAIHEMSPRAARAMIAVNCANLSDTLLESELFGYEAGAFTGATKRKDGLFVTANGSTLFLDEISTMRPDLQARLLRVLEERTVRRLGGTSETRVDVRILAASNRNLPKMVAEGAFREDLYHRLNVVDLKLPPLRTRREDIPALVGFFIQRYNREMGRSIQGVRPPVLDALKAYDWPGNIRQLRNTIERAMLFATGDMLEMAHFEAEIVGTPALA